MGKGAGPILSGDRRIFILVLDEIVGMRPGMACGIVTRAGLSVPHVGNSVMPYLSIEVGADYVDGDRRYTWARTGGAIGPVDDPYAVADAVAAALRMSGRERS